MTPEFKTKWIEGLRSGKYLQGHESLKTGVGFCCLGVALDLIDPTQWNSLGWGQRDDEEPVVSMCDTDLDDRFMLRYGTCDYLANLNDGSVSQGIQPATFGEIADYIEKYL